MNHKFYALSLLCIIAIGCKDAVKTTEIGIDQIAETKAIPKEVDFSLHIKPILSDRCFKCHGPDKNAVEGNLSLHTAEEAYKALGEAQDHFAVVPGDPEKSSLVARIYTDDPGLLMPPPESNLTLTDVEKELLRKWITQGAEYKKHWAFIPPVQPKVPAFNNTNWIQNEIDAFVFQKLEENQFKPSEKAPREILVRRLYLDLTGLPPTLNALDSLVSLKEDINWEKLIDQLLNSTDYAEHMAADWMEVARYADTHGYQDDFERTMWPWRDWVIHAFDENMPYDQFVTMQLAGDLLRNANKESILATGFNRNHKITAEGGVIPEEYRIEYVEDRTNTFGTAFLGMTMECARCHDHKYDPISQKEHFQLFSFFNGIDEDGLMANGSVIPKPYIKITKEEADKVLDFINLSKSQESYVTSLVMDNKAKERPTYVLNRGVYDQPGEQVFPETPTAILPYPETYPKNRLGLAKWLFHKDNPLTARIMVNRLWQKMYGKGIVASSYDFGNQGSLPTHPELLDYLAIKFQEENWDIKKMLKFMALSATYQQSSKITPEALEKDPENDWLARAPRIRLSASAIRDQALQLGGLLHKEIGGPSVKPYQPDGLWEETTGGGGGSTATYVVGSGTDLYRKSLYTFWKRTVPPPSMITFDASSRDLCSVKREDTNTPLQALVLLNDPQIIEAARAMAAPYAENNGTIHVAIKALFRNATGRMPTADELTKLTTFHEDMKIKVAEGAIVPTEYLAIGNYTNEKITDQEAWTCLALTAHAILNLDETITRG